MEPKSMAGLPLSLLSFLRLLVSQQVLLRPGKMAPQMCRVSPISGTHTSIHPRFHAQSPRPQACTSTRTPSPATISGACCHTPHFTSWSPSQVGKA